MPVLSSVVVATGMVAGLAMVGVAWMRLQQRQHTKPQQGRDQGREMQNQWLEAICMKAKVHSPGPKRQPETKVVQIRRRKRAMILLACVQAARRLAIVVEGRDNKDQRLIVVVVA